MFMISKKFRYFYSIVFFAFDLHFFISVIIQLNDMITINLIINLI